MSEPIRILGEHFPNCGEEGCKSLAQDGYCLATCCAGTLKAYCYQHSHRARLVIELLGHAHSQETFTALEVRAIVSAMWNGGNAVMGSMGYLEMVKDVARARVAEAQKGAGAPSPQPIEEPPAASSGR